MSTIYIFSFFKMFLVIMPVFVPFLQGLGLTMTQVMQTQAVFALTVATVEIPTGYFADRFGRGASLLAGSVLYGLSFSSLLLARDFFDIVLYEIAIGIAMGFVNGADVALLYEHLHRNAASKSTKDPSLPPRHTATSKAFANLQLSSVLGESTAALLAGFIALHGLRPVLVAQAIVCWIPLICVLRMGNLSRGADIPVHDKRPPASWRDAAGFIQWMFRENPLGTRVLFGQVTAGLSSFVAVWLLQKYWETRQVPIEWFGVLWAALNISAGMTGKVTHYLRETFGSGFVIGMMIVIPVVSYTGLASSTTSAGVVFCFGFYICRGLTQVLLRDMFNAHIPDRFRATANSLPSFMFRGSFAILGPAVGWSADRIGLNQTLYGLAFFFAALAPVLLPVMLNPRRYERVTVS
jgi:MFS family permease